MTRAQLIEWAKSEIDAFPSLKTCSTAAAVLEAEAAAEGLAKALEEIAGLRTNWTGPATLLNHLRLLSRIEEIARSALAAWRSRGGGGTTS